MAKKIEQEIHENDLQAFLSRVRDFWAHYGTKILIVVLLILTVLTIQRYMERNAVAAQERAYSDLESSSNPAGCLQLVGEYDDAVFQVRARLKAADLYLADSLRAVDQATAQVRPAKDLAEDLVKAQEIYTQVVNDPKADKLFRLNAKLGLAMVAEGMGGKSTSSDTAAKLLAEVRDEAGTDNPEIRKRAEGHLAFLNRLTEPVQFKPEPVATQPSTTSPAGLGSTPPPVSPSELPLSIPGLIPSPVITPGPTTAP